jgi:Leucine-rich repeat (LRR) protein
MRNTLIQWVVKEQTCESENASLSELRNLNQLTTLDIQIPNVAHLPKNLFFDQLYSYKIVIGDLNAYSEMDFKIPEKYELSRFLAIQLKDGFDIHSLMGIKMLFEKVEYLFLEDLHGVKDIFYRLNLKGFTYLRHLLVANNSNIQALINPKERRHSEKAFPKLESLYLYNLDNFDKLCSCKLSIPSLGKLKIIKINLCGKLESLFSISVVRLLTVLETIEVSECYALREIVEVETHNNTSEIEVLEVLELAELRSLTLQSFSDQFVGFYPISSTIGERKTLFNEKVCLKISCKFVFTFQALFSYCIS